MENDNLIDSENEEGAMRPFFLSLEDIRPHLLNPHLKESQLVELIREMSLKFTKQRSQIGDYVLDDDHVSAYATLYLTTNIPKLHFLLSKLDSATLSDLKNRPLIDVGVGPGTFSLGWCLFFNSFPKMIYCIDSSKSMLSQAKKILNGFFPQANITVEKKYNEKNSESVLFYGHSINEIGIEKVQDQIMVIDPEYVIWIEPGTSQTFLELKKLRSSLLEHYDVLYPCPSHESCPNDWCHQVLRTTHDASVERLSQLVSLDRKILPMIAHVYRRKSQVTINPSATIIRFLIETKFSFEYEVCLFENGQNINRVVEIQKKTLDKKTEKKFKNLNVGEKINFSVDKIIGEKYRIKLSNL